MRFDNSLSRTYLLACALGLLPTLAHAQEGGEEVAPEVPAKRAAPIIDKRALSIPGRLPEMKPVPKPGLNSIPIVQPGAGAAAPAAAAGSNFAAQPGRPAEGDVTALAGSGCRKMPAHDRVPFEFKDADIKDVVTAVSKMMCKNFIITSKVRSQKFDIVSPTKIRVDEAWQAFLSALEANDFALFEVGKFSKIIQATDATRAPVEIYEDGRRIGDPDDRMVTKIWKIQSAGDVNAVVNYLNIFKSGKGQIHPFAATNTVIATDYASSIARLERILDEIDVPGVSERVHVIAVDHASATEVAEKLNQIFEPTKAGQAQGKSRGPGGPLKPIIGKRSGAEIGVATEGASVSKIMADDRTNRLIIIASEDGLKQIMALKKKLDIPAEGAGEGQVHVLRLRHANAEELASTLGALAQGKPTSGRATRTSGSTGNKSPAAAAPVPAAAGGTAANSASLFQGDVKVTSDKPTNSLIITASKADFISMKRVIASLDVARYQVYVEAAIMEISVKRDRTFGISVHGGANPQIDGDDAPLIFTSQPSGMSSLASTLNPASLLSTPGISGLLRGPVLPGSETIVPGGIPAFGVLLQAVQGSNDVNIISTPQLLTMDNEEAEIQVSEKRPFSSGLSLGGLSGLSGLGGASSALSSLGGLGLGSVNITREDVGLTLKLKPQINDQQYVRLEIDQELSDVIGTDANTQQPITSKRAAKTVVVVRDQDSVVIGGLVRDRETESEGKTPLLGDIPLIGWLFKRQTTQFEKVNLVLVLTPYIIRGPEDFYKIYERKMKERREFLDRYYGDTPDFRANVDWDRKPGPLAQYRSELRDELLKAENGGPGAVGETVVTPEDALETETPVDMPPDGETPAIITPGDSAPPPPAGEAAPPAFEPPPPVTDGEP